MSSPLSIGVMFRREQAPETLVRYARRVEEAGVDELWVVEDCFFTGGISQAATALGATSEITVGLGIAPAVARNASFLAMEFATLARVHPGRFHGGIGHGVARWMDQIGARPASWLAALEETTVAVRSLLAGNEVSIAGRTVQLRDVRLEHVPEPAPLVSLGVRGEKSLTLAGRCADGTVLAEGSSPAYVRWARDRIAEGRHLGTSVPRHHRVTVYALCSVSQAAPGRAREDIRTELAPIISGGSASPQASHLPYASNIDALVAEGGIEALATRMPDAWIDDLAVAGSPAQAAASIASLGEAGADSVVLVPPPDLEPDAWLDRVADELVPELRQRE